VTAIDPGMARPRPSFLAATARIFDLSLGEMLWARRTLFMALLVAAPVLLAVVSRIVSASGGDVVRINRAGVDRAGMFGIIMWIPYLRFAVPALGVFYGTSLIGDEVEDKTITYLFTRPIPRRSIVMGKYLAYVVCALSVVLPSVMIVFMLMVPFREMGASFGTVLADLGILAAGLAVYGAVFLLAGVTLKRPLVAGLVFAFGWEQITLLMPGYLKRFTIAYYLQALMPQAMPTDDTLLLLQAVTQGAPSVTTSLLWLLAVLVVALILAMRAVERREFVLEQ
jgi:ABC-2 type transport system permease protein